MEYRIADTFISASVLSKRWKLTNGPIKTAGPLVTAVAPPISVLKKETIIRKVEYPIKIKNKCE
jgi:hypothetical protein